MWTYEYKNKKVWDIAAEIATPHIIAAYCAKHNIPDKDMMKEIVEMIAAFATEYCIARHKIIGDK